MKQAFSLIRVSGEGQTRRDGAEQGYSIENQRDACRRKARQLEADVVQEWTAPAESASRGLYKTLKEMLAALKERRDIDYVIIYKLERFARDELTDFSAYAEIRAAGAELVSATENIDGTPQGMLLHGILTSINAFYSRDLAEKITDGRITKAKLGGTPGRAPLGYLNKKRWDGQNDIRYVEVDPERAPHIRWAFEAYATGDKPLNALVEDLYDRGLRSRPTPKRPAGRVGLSSIHRMLRNPYYIGTIAFRGVEYEGTHPKLITPELFERVQQILTAHSVAAERHWKHEHYLRGTIYCGAPGCGRRMIFTKVTGKSGGRYHYFVCASRHQRTGCDMPYLPAHRVEEDVADYYGRQVRLDAERVAWLEPRLIQCFHYLTAYRRDEATRRRGDVDRIRNQRRKLVDDHLANPQAIPLDLLEEKQAELGRRLTTARKALAKAEADIGRGEDGLRLARKLLDDSAAAYREVDPPTRRAWNQSFFRKLFIGKHGIAGADLTGEYAALLSDDLAAKLEAMPFNPAALCGRGSNVACLVETPGVEPGSAVVRMQLLRA